MHNLSYGLKPSRSVNATAAGTTAVNGAAVDMQGFEGVMFVALLGTLTATQVTKLQVQYSADGSTNWTNITDDAIGGTLSTGAAADADSNKIMWIDIYRPKQRYLRAVVSRGTANAVIDGVLAIQYHPALQPTALDATVATGANADGDTTVVSIYPHS